MNKILGSKIDKFFGKISFGIYSLHWPVFCSLGMLILSKTAENFGLLQSSLIAIIVSITVSIIFSVLFYYVIEQHIYKLLKTVEKTWRKHYE